MSHTFPRKAFGRIFVEKEEDVQKVKDHFWLSMAYTHKFDSLNLNELQFRCWAAGIKVFCCLNYNGNEDYGKYECYDVWED